MIGDNGKRDLAIKAKKFHDLFSTQLGQEVFAEIVKEAGDGTQLFVKGDAHATSYNVGKFDLASYIGKLAKIGANVEVK